MSRRESHPRLIATWWDWIEEGGEYGLGGADGMWDENVTALDKMIFVFIVLVAIGNIVVGI